MLRPKNPTDKTYEMQTFRKHLHTLTCPTSWRNKDNSEITKYYESHFIYSVSGRVKWPVRRLLSNKLLNDYLTGKRS